MKPSTGSRPRPRPSLQVHEAEASCYEDEAETEVKAEDKVIVTIFYKVKKCYCIFTVK